MTKLAIIHTTPVTIETLKHLAEEKLPGCEIINFVDDSILPELGQNGGDVTEVQERLIQYAMNAEKAGADVILNACSSVGEVVPLMRQKVAIPVVRIDEAMAELAVTKGEVIGVAATLSTTLEPTIRLIQDKAKASGKQVQIKSALAGEAYARLMAGDMEGHDAALKEVLEQLVDSTDVVVLAQASMARVVETLPAEKRSHFFTSPALGMERVATTMKRTV
ncbi:MAG TPA: aspartate/glutamate racemase family protein [Sporolactobacillaceae bacterium]|nr:aspartate/glutamate racemase family protein [Sporolactobacillaceae bacterium]